MKTNTPENTHVLALLDCDSRDIGDRLHPQLLHRLPALLLATALLALARRSILI